MMNRTKQLLASSALATLALAVPASADVTPQQVWDELGAYLAGFGYTVTGTETADGDTLTISDFAMRMDMPEEDGNLTLAADEIVLTDLGDGSVSVTFPESMPVTMAVDPADGEAVDVRLDYTQTALDFIVSGTPEEMVYDYTAQSMGLALSELVVEGEPVSRDMARFDIAMSGLEGTSTMATGEMRKFAQDMTIAELRYDVAFSEPEPEAGEPGAGDAGMGRFSGRMEDLSFEGATTLPIEMVPGDTVAMFESGVAGEGVFAHSGGSMAFAVTEAGQTTTGETSTASAEISVALSGDAVTYEVQAMEMALTMSSPDLPFPVAAQMAENSFNMTIPLAKAETPQDVALGLTLGGFTMSDMLWNIFDPKETLPRDPATVSVDLVGTVTPFINLFDPEAMATLEETGGVPGELNSLTLRDLTVEAVGTSLDGSGDFTFDNNDLTTYDGMPAPSGTVTLMLDGGNALIDRLIEMGLLAQQDAMGARMMMSMFAVPGTGEDSLTSTIEVKGNGQILANGQRIR